MSFMPGLLIIKRENNARTSWCGETRSEKVPCYTTAINTGFDKASPTLPHNTYYGSRILVSHFVAWKPHIELPHRGLSTAIQPVKTCCNRVLDDGQLALEFIIYISNKVRYHSCGFFSPPFSYFFLSSCRFLYP
jgi:hypothetical protein